MRQQGATLAAARAGPRAAGRLAVAGGLALVVAVALYAVGRAHTPSSTMGLLGQHGFAVNRLKAQLGTAMLGLGLVQLTLALWMYRRLPGAGAAPPAVPVLHRLGGASLFLLSLPVAMHCLLAYGVQLGGPRVAVHSRWPAASSTARSRPRCCWCGAGGCRAGRCRSPAGCSSP